MRFSDAEISENILDGFELANPGLRSAAVMALQETLAEALANTESLDEMWEVFKDTLIRRQYADFTRDLCESTRNEIYARIIDKEYSRLRSEAVRRIVADDHTQLRADAVAQIKAAMESEKAITEMKKSIRHRLEDLLRPQVAAKLKAELQADPVFIEQVKTDLKKQIMGL